MSDSAITLSLLGVLAVLFVSNKLPVEVVAIGAALTLYGTGVLDLREALAGFSDQAVILIAALFVVSEGLDASGVTSWAGRELVRLAGDSRRRLLLLTMLLVALLSAMISVNGAVAALLPVVVLAANRLNQSPSQLLMPMVFASFSGSLLALTGSPVNVVVAEAAANSGDGFGFFEFALVGVPLVLTSFALILLLGERLLPMRAGRHISADLAAHTQTLAEHYRLHDGPARLKVRQDSPLVGRTPDEIPLQAYEGLALIGVHNGSEAESRDSCLKAGDILAVTGPAETVRRLANDQRLGIRSTPGPERLMSEQVGLAEVIIPPRSALIGETITPGMTNDAGNVVVLAVQPAHSDRPMASERLEAGDTLLLQGSWDALDESLGTASLLVVDSPELVRRKALPLGPAGLQAIAVLIAMILMLVSNVTPAVVGVLLAAGAMVLLGIVRLPAAYRAINWTAVILVAAMIPVSTAMTQTGAAEDVAQVIVDLVGNSSPYFLLAALFLVTAGFSQLISSTATALIMIPVSLSAAADIGISPQPVLMCLAVAAVSSFLTPVATPVNLMIMEPAGYEFGDYWKLGLPLLLLFMLVAVFLVPLFWPF